MKISYVEDKNLIAYCFSKRDYSAIAKFIDRNASQLNYSIEVKDSLFGYKIKKVKQLSEIYERDFFSVEFSLKNIGTNFQSEYEKHYISMMKHLLEELCSKKGYYIIKIPSSNTNLINAFNKTLNKAFNKANKTIKGSQDKNKILLFAGGTVCYSTEKQTPFSRIDDGIAIIKLKKEKFKKYSEQLLLLGKNSFDNYSGQYHTSYFTRSKAHVIYRNWVNDHLTKNIGNIFVGLKEDEVVGFLTTEETDKTVEIVLNAVKENYRGNKIYERLVRKTVEESLKAKKIITVSTAFNNYFPQRTWINVGFKPYHSFYLFHYNNL